MKNLLIIASHSTSKAGARGIQAQRLIKALSELYNVYLITSENSYSDQITDFMKLKKIFIMPDLSHIIQGIMRRAWFFLSQRDFRYCHYAKKKASSIIRKYEIDTVLTLSTFYSNADTGMHLKELFSKKKLISFLSDPLSINPLFYSKNWQKTYLVRYERKIFSRSDITVFPSGRMLEMYSDIYPEYAGKMTVIPHSYSKQENGMAVKDKAIMPVKKISHFGLLYKKRNPMAMLEFISGNRDYFIKNSFEFHFYGTIERSLKKKMACYESDLIHLHSQIPYRDVEQRMLESFALLVIDANFRHSPFLPSKLVEYLPYNIPVIGITPDNSESQRVLEETGNYFVNYSHMDSFIDVLDSIICNYEPSMNNISRYEIGNVINQWKEII